MHGTNIIKTAYLRYMQYVNLLFWCNLQIAKIKVFWWK
jgi:hypothetical protein